MNDLANIDDGPSDILTPEIRLWRAILAEMISNAFGHGAALPQHDIHAARHWLRLDNLDFRLVCWYGGYEPEFVIRQVEARRKALAAARPARGGRRPRFAA